MKKPIFALLILSATLMGAKDCEAVAPAEQASCTCAEGELTAVSGCESFGGDQEQCSGWESCEVENGLPAHSTHESGTTLTCFGCTIQLICK